MSCNYHCINTWNIQENFNAGVIKANLQTMYSTTWQLYIFALLGLQREITPTKLPESAWQLLWALRGTSTLIFINKSPNMTARSLTWPRPSICTSSHPSTFLPTMQVRPGQCSETCMRQKLSGSWHRARISLKSQNNLLPLAARAQQSCVTHSCSAHSSYPLGHTRHA